MLAALTPGLLVAAALGIEVTGWMSAQVTLQRAADLAAIAGAMDYQSRSCTPADLTCAQAVATSAARLAQLNGASGVATPTWNGATKTLTDGSIVVQVVTGTKQVSNTALKVTVSQSVSATIGQAVGLNGTTVGASSTAELVTVPGGGGQPCLLTLKTSSTNITVSGSGSLSNPLCNVRSNGSISVTGSAQISAYATYAAGTISGGGSIAGLQYPNAGTIADPYASYAPVTAAIGQLGSGGTAAVGTSNGTPRLDPGTYASLTVTGSNTLNLNPGLYIVNGDITVGGSSSTMNGSGVTIVTKGKVNISGKASLSAPGTTPSGGAISGFLFIGNGNVAWQISGGSNTSLSGVVYAPRVSLTYSGSAITSPSQCLWYIVNDVTVSGAASMYSSCTTLGVPGFGSSTSTVKGHLVL